MASIGSVRRSENPQWWGEAKCQSADPEVFFPEKGGSARDAKRVCRDCSVRVQCLEYALNNEERFGVFGGMSERERRHMQRDRSQRLRPITYIRPESESESGSSNSGTGQSRKSA